MVKNFSKIIDAIIKHYRLDTKKALERYAKRMREIIPEAS